MLTDTRDNDYHVPTRLCEVGFTVLPTPRTRGAGSVPDYRGASAGDRSVPCRDIEQVWGLEGPSQTPTEVGVAKEWTEEGPARAKGIPHNHDQGQSP